MLKTRFLTEGALLCLVPALRNAQGVEQAYRTMLIKQAGREAAMEVHARRMLAVGLAVALSGAPPDDRIVGHSASVSVLE